MNGSGQAPGPDGLIPTSEIPQFVAEKIPIPRDRDVELRPAYEKAIREHVELFNKDVLRTAAALEGEIQQSKQGLLGNDEAQLSATGRTLLHHYAVADALAIHFDRRTQMAGVLLFLLGGVAMLALEGCHLLAILAHAPDAAAAPWKTMKSASLGLFVGLWAVVFLCWGLARWGRWQTKHEDYRALAEGLRVQLFWHLAGLPDAAADHYVPKHGGELAWVRYALHTRHPGGQLRNQPASGALPSEARLDLVLPHWVDDQRNWFRAKAAANLHRSHRIELSARVLFFGAWLLAAALLIGPQVLPAHQQSWLEEHTHSLLFAVGAMVVTAACLLGYKERRAFAEQANSYEVMRDLFQYARDRYDRKDPPAMVLHELGRDALTENGDWLLMHRERPLEPKI